jgi:predicted acylesterase/phospholipase RssA
MKRALVLSGGGSRGAYEIGAWQAMEEMGVRFDAVYGTSIGALNAGLVAQGDVDKAIGLWQNIRMDQVIRGAEGDFSIDRMLSRKRDVIPFLLENAKYLNADVTPLENLLREYLDEKKVRTSGMELGVMTVRVPQMQPAPVRLKDMQEGRMNDWLIASASCFPVFPA